MNKVDNLTILVNSFIEKKQRMWRQIKDLCFILFTVALEV